MKDLLLAIAKKMVDYADQVQVKEQHGEDTVLLVLSVAKQDLGKIIGKMCKNIATVRTIMNAGGVKLHKHFIVELKE